MLPNQEYFELVDVYASKLCCLFPPDKQIMPTVNGVTYA